MDARKNRGIGKSDALDARRIAAAALPLPVEKLRRPRLNEGIRQGLQILVTARESMAKNKTRSINALNALVRSNGVGIDARKKLTPTQVEEISRWREREEELALGIARAEAVRLAKHILDMLAQASIAISDSAPEKYDGIIAKLDESLNDPFIAEDLVTAMQFTKSASASIDDVLAGSESHNLWHRSSADESRDIMTGLKSTNSGSVAIRRVPFTPTETNASYEDLFAAIGEPLNVVVVGHDLKFAGDIISKLEADGHRVVIDKWAGHSQHDEEQSLLLLEDADVIFCEWSLGNLAWYSQHKLPGQRLVSRFHSQELFTKYPTQVDFSKVDQIIFVGEFIRRVAIRKFGIPEELTTVIPNTVNLESLDRPKIDGAEFNLGLVGIVPEQKGLDVALDLLAELRESDERYHLFIKGRRPEDYPWMADRPKEMAFFEAQYSRIEIDPRLQGAVTFDEHGNDMADWYRKIGIALSVSAFESFHFTIADGAASGAIPVSLAWPGSELVYPASWLSTSVSGLATRIQGVAGNSEKLALAALEAKQFARNAYAAQSTLDAVTETLTRIK